MTEDAAMEGGAEEKAQSKPDVDRLAADYRRSRYDRANLFWSRQRVNHEARYCLWQGQTPDARKWPKNKERVFPWKGANDARLYLVDGLIREDVAVLMQALRAGRIVVRPTESNDAALASRMTDVLRWMVQSQMTELAREARLVAEWMLERGSVVLLVCWHNDEQLGWQTITMEEVAAAAMLAQGQLDAGQVSDSLMLQAQLPALIMDPTQEEQVAELAQAWAPDLDQNQRRKAVRDLRETGEARFVVPMVGRPRPKIRALMVNDEFFMPPEAVELESARCVFVRELLTETDLKSRVRSMGWNAEWVNAVIENHRGRVETPEAWSSTGNYNRLTLEGELPETSELYEIVHAYERRYDDSGVPGIWYSVFHPGILSDSIEVRRPWGFHELLNYQHGKMPFVLFRREIVSRVLDDSRGMGEIGASWERVIKVEVDTRVDRASIATLPPSYYPPGDDPDSWGPGVQIPTSRPDSYGFFETPKWDLGSKEVQETLWGLMRRYFGRPVDEFNIPDAQALRQEAVNLWLDGWREALVQIMQLMQQFMPEQFWYRVQGGGAGMPVPTSRQEIQGQFDASVSFDVKTLDQEYIKEKLAFLQAALQMDATGIIDRAEVLKVAFEMVDPNLGERLLRPTQAVTAQEAKDERNTFNMLLNGIIVNVEPGQNYQLRLQVLQQLFQGSQTAQQRYQENPEVKNAFDNRVKQLQHQVEQQQNQAVGIYGAAPSQIGRELEMAVKAQPNE